MLTTNKCESPIVAYNYFILKLQEEIMQLYFDKKTARSMISSDFIFENDSITLFRLVKFFIEDNKIKVKFLKAISQKELFFVTKTSNNFDALSAIFNKYRFLINSASKNIDDSISQKMLDDIVLKIQSNKITFDEVFIIPIAKKLDLNYAFCNDELFKNLAKRQVFVIRFNSHIRDCFEYKIQLLFESELSQLQGSTNCKPESIETVKSGVLNKAHLNQFLINLFYYGNIS